MPRRLTAWLAVPMALILNGGALTAQESRFVSEEGWVFAERHSELPVQVGDTFEFEFVMMMGPDGDIPIHPFCDGRFAFDGWVETVFRRCGPIRGQMNPSDSLRLVYRGVVQEAPLTAFTFLDDFGSRLFHAGAHRPTVDEVAEGVEQVPYRLSVAGPEAEEMVPTLHHIIRRAIALSGKSRRGFATEEEVPIWVANRSSLARIEVSLGGASWAIRYGHCPPVDNERFADCLETLAGEGLLALGATLVEVAGEMFGLGHK